LVVLLFLNYSVNSSLEGVVSGKIFDVKVLSYN